MLPSELTKDFSRVFVVYDRNVEDRALELIPWAEGYGIIADEAHKTLDTVMDICRWLLSQGADRNCLVVAVGGGVTTDMTGFAASIYKRGVAYANVPTTLLSMVDAGIGGKTGVNLDGYKNMLGVICQPQWTHVEAGFLETLPEKEIRSGLAELLKTFILGDADMYRDCVEVLKRPYSVLELEPFIKRAAEIKAEIVRQDPYEKGLRRVLNLGHTWAHAIEWWQAETDQQDRLSHGEAVAIGIICAAKKSEELQISQPGLAEQLRADFEACGLPVELPCDESLLLDAMGKDKKAEGKGVNYVLIERIGSVTVRKI